MDDYETRARNAIKETAREMVKTAERNGKRVTQEEAEDYARKILIEKERRDADRRNK